MTRWAEAQRSQGTSQLPVTSLLCPWCHLLPRVPSFISGSRAPFSEPESHHSVSRGEGSVSSSKWPVELGEGHPWTRGVQAMLWPQPPRLSSSLALLCTPKAQGCCLHMLLPWHQPGQPGLRLLPPPPWLPACCRGRSASWASGWPWHSGSCRASEATKRPRTQGGNCQGLRIQALSTARGALRFLQGLTPTHLYTRPLGKHWMSLVITSCPDIKVTPEGQTPRGRGVHVSGEVCLAGDVVTGVISIAPQPQY